MSTPNPAQISARSENSAYAEATPQAEASAPCRGCVIVRASYDDYWKTPMTLAPLKVDDLNGTVFNGDIRTQGLLNFGLRDGLATPAIRPQLGFVQAADAQRGALAVETVVSPAAEARVVSLEREILADLDRIGRDMQTAIQPWVAEWEQRGVFGAFKTFIDSVGNGMAEWWKGEGDFWSAVGEWISNIPEMAQDALDAANSATRLLWENRQKLVDLLRSLANGDINLFQETLTAMQNVFDFIIEGVGSMTELMAELLQHSYEWSAGMIEMATRTRVLPALGATALGVLIAIPPNFWAEIVGNAMGFLIPEAIIAILLFILAAFTGGAGAGPLAARAVRFAVGIKRRLRGIDRGGDYFVRMLDALHDLLRKLEDLVSTLLNTRKERRLGQTDTEIPIVRRTRNMNQIDPGCFDAVRNARERAPNNPEEQQRIMKEYARQLRDQQDGMNDMTVGEYLDARNAYTELSRKGVSNGKAQEAARAELQNQIADSVQNSMEASGMDSYEAAEAAEKRAGEIMSNLAALHNPDMVAGGQDVIGRVGDARVNSSIGGSWGDHTKPTSRIAKMDAAARAAAADPAIGRDARMNVKLEPCRGRK